MKKLFKHIERLNQSQQQRVGEFLNIVVTPLDDIFKKIENLNRAQQLRVNDFINVLRRPIDEWTNENSEYVDKPFAEEFRSRILTQHAFQHRPLFQDTFDAAFIAALKASGKKCNEASAGERFWDLELDGFRISLKSTKEAALNLKKLKISKLTEAAWIQDCRTAAMREQYTKELFTEYINIVGTIFQLRYFSNKRFYELVEIPIQLFRPILDVPREYFNSDGPTIDIPVGSTPPILKLKIDRSDSKITINGILKDHCIVHGTWGIVE